MMRTSLSRVRHFGSAHDGTGHFWIERVTGAASFLLTIVFIVVTLVVVGRPHDEVVSVLGSPIIAALLVLYIAVVAMHMRVGMEAIIVDYVSGDAAKMAWLVANTFFSVVVAAIGIVAALRIAFGS